MADNDLKALAEKMRDIDLCMLATQAESGAITSRPMSNNADVEYDGDAWFFTYEDSNKVREIKANPEVSIQYQGKGEGDGPGLFVTVEAAGEVVTDRAVLEEHWYDELERWFPDGLETEGITLIKAHASQIRWWDGEEGGELSVR